MQLHRGINFSCLEVPADAGGAIFVLGSVIALMVGLPPFRWFFLGATLLGGVTALALSAWHRRHPERPARERMVALGLARDDA